MAMDMTDWGAGKPKKDAQGNPLYYGAPGVDRTGPAWLDPNVSKAGDWEKGGSLGADWVSTGQNPLYGPRGTNAFATAAGDSNQARTNPNAYQGSGGGVPFNALTGGTAGQAAGQAAGQQQWSDQVPVSRVSPVMEQGKDRVVSFNALTGQSTPAAPPMQVANGNAARNADVFNNPVYTPPAPTGPRAVEGDRAPFLPGETPEQYRARNPGQFAATLPTIGAGESILPPVPAGFDVRAGSQDPAVNRQIYGENYFPGNLPGFPGIANKEQFFALTPQQQGDYRVTLAAQFKAGQPGGGAPGPATGVGAGRGYPSNWNINNAPGLDSGGEGTTFATNPATGAAYETSPMYQWQLKQGEKSINRALAARGRKNSSVGLNTLANFYNQLGAGEADKQYTRTFQQQQLGLQAALAQAAQAGASSQQLAQLYAQLGGQAAGGSERYGGNIADLIARYGEREGSNVLGLGTQQGAAAMWKGTPIGALLDKHGGENYNFWTSLSAMGGKAVADYMASRGK